MKFYAITSVYCEAEILSFGLTRALKTIGPFQINQIRWTVMDHLWPLNREDNKLALPKLSALVDALYLEADCNRGGIGGYNWVLNQLPVKDEDFVLIYDPDSNPLMSFWFQAMVQVMQADPSIPYLSLLDDRVARNRPWKMKEVAGHRVASDSQPEMINVTLYRGSMIKNGLPNHTLYGGIESDLWALGHKGSYLYDFREKKCPLDHPKEYTDWKRAHAFRLFKGPFEEFPKSPVS